MGEAAAPNVIAWFVDHRRQHHCFEGRLIMLYENFDGWERRIKQAWGDR